MDVFDDLAAEEDTIEAILSELDEAAWLSPSGARGWTVCDVVLHLAQSEEAVVATAPDAATMRFARDAVTLDDVMDLAVQAERAAPAIVFERWRAARRAA